MDNIVDLIVAVIDRAWKDARGDYHSNWVEQHPHLKQQTMMEAQSFLVGIGGGMIDASKFPSVWVSVDDIDFEENALYVVRCTHLENGSTTYSFVRADYVNESTPYYEQGWVLGELGSSYCTFHGHYKEFLQEKKWKCDDDEMQVNEVMYLPEG